VSILDKRKKRLFPRGAQSNVLRQVKPHAFGFIDMMLPRDVGRFLMQIVLCQAVEINITRTVFEMATGTWKESPFPTEVVEEVRRKIREILLIGGRDPTKHPEDVYRFMDIRLMQAMAESTGDPDSSYLDQVAIGVRVGTGIRMPTTPAVFNKKVKRKLHEIGEEEEEGG
jgi:hypothetical protein